MRLIISALAGALLAACSACTIVPQKPAPVPSAPVVVEPASAGSTGQKVKAKKQRELRKEAKRESKKDARSKKQQIRSVVSKGNLPDCGLVRWAANTFDEDRIKRLERTASAEQKKHAKACLDGRG